MFTRLKQRFEFGGRGEEERIDMGTVEEGKDDLKGGESMVVVGEEGREDVTDEDKHGRRRSIIRSA